MTRVQAAACRLLPVLNWLGRPAILSALGTVVFIVFICAILLLAALQPGYPYDYVPYLGATLEWLGADAAEAHRQAFASLQAIAPPDVFAAITTGDEYRLRQSTDPAAFASILPFYSIKIGYLGLLAGALEYGDPAGWAWVASLIAGLATGIVVLFWLHRYGATLFAPVLAALMLGAGFFELVRNPLPDVIAAPLLLLAALLWLRGGDWLWLLPLSLAFLFRPDTVIFALALMLAASLFGQRALPAAIALVGLLAASFWLEGLFDHPGWWTHYWFSNVSIQPTLEGFSEPFSILAYLKGQARGVVQSITQTHWLMPAILTVVAGLASLRLQERPPNRQLILYLACVLTVAGKFVLFPLPDDRLYFPFIVIAALCIAPAYAKALTGRTAQRPERSSSRETG